MKTRVVTNIADLTPAMRELLRRPTEFDLPAEAMKGATVDALHRRGLVSLMSLDPPVYRLTGAGVRARAALEREAAPIVVTQALGSYGWSLLAETDFGGHSITTWTRDEHSLVLSWTGAYEVSAAILDGTTLPLGQLLETVMNDDEGDTSSADVLSMAAQRALLVTPGRFSTELAALLAAFSDAERQGVASRPLDQIQLAATMLAGAILSTPHAR